MMAAAAPAFAQLLAQSNGPAAAAEVCTDKRAVRDAVAGYRKGQRERLEAIVSAAVTPGEGETRYVRLGRAPLVQVTRKLAVAALKVQASTLRWMHKGRPVKTWPDDVKERNAAALRARLRSKHAVGPAEKMAIVRTIGGREVIEVVEGTVEALHRAYPDAVSVETWRQAGAHVPRVSADLVAGQRRPRPVTG